MASGLNPAIAKKLYENLTGLTNLQKPDIITMTHDNVQNQQAIAERLCTKSSPSVPLFFIGSSPSLASRIISCDYPAAGAFIQLNTLKQRISYFEVGDWVFDCSGFMEVSKYGTHRTSVEEHFQLIHKWKCCGNLLIAVSQDWMCEPWILDRTGLTVQDHQRLTIDRYDKLMALKPLVPIMPVLQGYRSSEYIECLLEYGSRLKPGAWVGIGSVCRRNGKPDEVANILRSIKLLRSDLRLHGFGLKILALENNEVRKLLYSCDSMAWSYPRRFQPIPEPEIPMAHQYQKLIYSAVTDSVQKRVPKTAGAGNGQGRKPKWNSVSESVRIPKKYIPRVVDLCRQWQIEEDVEKT
ncbi:MAG: hypothetical protein V7K47_26265 [Nostoc sp.]